MHNDGAGFRVLGFEAYALLRLEGPASRVPSTSAHKERPQSMCTHTHIVEYIMGAAAGELYLQSGCEFM